MWKQKRAIVLGAEHPRAVALIQSLGGDGVPVVVIDHAPSPLGFFSRYVTQKFCVPNATEATLTLLEQLSADGGVLFPTNDEYLILTSKNYEKLSASFVLTTPAWDRLGPVMDLSRFYKNSQQIGVRTPEFFKPNTEEDMLSYTAQLDFAIHSYLLKTPPGTAPADVRTGRFTKVAGSNVEEMRSNCMEIFARFGDFPLVAKVIPGGADRCIGVCMVINHNQEAVLSYCVRRLRLFTYSTGGRYIHPYELGSNVFCESIHDEEALHMAKRLVEHAKYFGFVAMEFRRDPTDEKLTLIKADPRPVRSLSLSRALNLDVAQALYRTFTSQTIPVARAYNGGIGWIWISAHHASLWRNRRDRPIFKELIAVVKRSHKIRAVANFHPSDPMPFLMDQFRWWRSFAQYLFKRLCRKISNLPNKIAIIPKLER